MTVSSRLSGASKKPPHFRYGLGFATRSCGRGCARPPAELDGCPQTIVTLSSVQRRDFLEEGAVIVAAFLATLYAEWRIVSGPLTFQADSTIHEYWMRRFTDGALFQDPLTESLLDTGYSPPAFRSLYWLASHVVDPVRFGELLPLVLVPFAVWLLFRIVRSHVEWRPAAWIGAALFLVPWEVHRFSGGHPRAFAQPIVLLTLLLLLSRRNLAAALVPPGRLAPLSAGGAVALGSSSSRPWTSAVRASLDFERVRWAGMSVPASGAAFVVTRLTTGSQEC